MTEWGSAGLDVSPSVHAAIPAWSEVVDRLRRSPGRSAAEVLAAADRDGRPVVQPRCGVGDHQRMRDLLRRLEQAGPGLLSITVDSHTRLGQFATVARIARRSPDDLNGYPLVAHGWRQGRELVDTVRVPLQVRHGSPDARNLFAVAIAAGITSFEGGGIGYNLPYSKDVPLHRSLRAWRQVDAACGQLDREAGVVVDRELFGTLTAVLVPPSISLAVTLLEATLAAREGIRCIGLAYPQGGELHQDIAALRAVRTLARRYLPPSVTVHPILHEFMGVFPRERSRADALIFYGGMVARLGGATKVISKTYQEAIGVPDPDANADGIRTAAAGVACSPDLVSLDQSRVEEEICWIEREVGELIEPVLEQDDLISAIDAAFTTGRLDIPFSASVHARSAIIPKRDASGAIRYLHCGDLPFSPETRARQAHCLRDASGAAGEELFRSVTADINYFLTKEPIFP